MFGNDILKMFMFLSKLMKLLMSYNAFTTSISHYKRYFDGYFEIGVVDDWIEYGEFIGP